MESNGQHTIGSGFIESFDSRYPTRILETLLQDRTTGRNIIWADNEYEALGEGYMGDDEITVEKITGLSSGVIKPRIAKEQEHQSKRTKSRAEVFTPSWLCNQMNNDIDAVWFNRRDVFNIEDNQSWRIVQEPIIFPKKRGYGWHSYVESPRLEITCGEAPFVCSRYDTVTGETLPVERRIGFLDRKLRVVSEKTKTRKEWVRWALAALKSSYGFEYQGDNLLLARINVFETFCEHLLERWGMGITDDELDQAAWIASWNFWQMNGFTCAVPTNKMDAVAQSTLFGFEEPVPEPLQPALFDLLDESPFDEMIKEKKEEEHDEAIPFCIIYDWQENKPFEFQVMKGKARPMDKKFYAVIGNPPYQEEVLGSTRPKPIYNHFMDCSFAISEKTELITPARFLFDSGLTPKEFNKRMLNDPHLKVEEYYPDGATVFTGPEIKGGVVITYRDSSKIIGPIRRMYKDERHRPLVEKVTSTPGFVSLNTIIGSQGTYKYTKLFFEENPIAQSVFEKGTKDKILSSQLDEFSFAFNSEKQEDSIKILGRLNNKRVYRWIKNEYVKEVGADTLSHYKVFMAEGQGSGVYGETLSEPIIGEPETGQTDTFLTFGCFSNIENAKNLTKYLKTKFARALLGALKVTQHANAAVWKFVPLQDFVFDSDIDWSKSISEIDKQLYAKYGLSQEEIDFIESHVKEMN